MRSWQTSTTSTLDAGAGCDKSKIDQSGIQLEKPTSCKWTAYRLITMMIKQLNLLGKTNFSSTIMSFSVSPDGSTTYTPNDSEVLQTYKSQNSCFLKILLKQVQFFLFKTAIFDSKKIENLSKASDSVAHNKIVKIEYQCVIDCIYIIASYVVSDKVQKIY